jgi:hypothetical protein
VVGKVFKPNRLKVLALNKTLNEYFMLVKWYLSFNSNTALIWAARDKAVEILRGFEENRKEDSVFLERGLDVED